MDLVRFLAGWGMWGNSGYATMRTMKLLQEIDGGKLISYDEY